MTQANNSNRRNAGVWLANIGLLLVMTGIALPLLKAGGDVYKYIFGVGAAITLTGRILVPSPKNVSLRVRRLCRMEMWCAIMFCVATFCMFYPGMRPSDWLAFTLAGGVLQVYSSLMVPRAIAKEKKESEGNVKK